MSDDDESLLQRLRDVVAAVEAEDHTEVIRLCKDDTGSYPDSIQAAIQKIHAKSLIQTQQCKEAAALISTQPDCKELLAYSLYQQKEYKQVVALAKLDQMSSTALKYMLAQSLYHMSDTSG